MRRYSAILVLILLAGAAPLAAGTGANFSLGLSGEYLGDSQELAGEISERDTLRTTLRLLFTGHVYDPRFLTFQGNVAWRQYNQEETAADDFKDEELLYEVGMQLFENRLVSGVLGAGRVDTDTQRGVDNPVVGGLEERTWVGIRVRPKQWPTLEIRRRDRSFDPKEQGSSRAQDETLTQLFSSVAYRQVRARLDVLSRQLELARGSIKQDSTIGQLFIDVFRDKPYTLHTVITGNRYRSATGGAELSARTQILSAQNRFRKHTQRGGFWQVFADFQQSSFEEDEAQSSQAGGNAVIPIGRDISLDSEVAYLLSETSGGGRLTQPTAAIGARWTPSLGKWIPTMLGRINYVSVSRETDPKSQSTLGALISGTAQRVTERGRYLLEGEFFNNQLSIAPVGPDDTVGGVSFLAGLEKERLRFRAQADYKIAARLNLLADATGTRRVRLRTEGEVTENLASARLSVRWRRFHLDSRMDQIKVVGGDLPTDTRLLRSELRWRVRRWLIVDGLVQRETRDTVGIEGTFDFEEVGVTLQYALFSFYARVRQQEFADAGNPTRRDRRAWVGIERVFNFGFGERFR